MVTIANGIETETYDERNERIFRIANHIKATNSKFQPIPVEFFLLKKEVDRSKSSIRDEQPDSIEGIMDRISVATKHSKILVVRATNGLKCYFANTAAGDFMIRAGVNVVGVFDNVMQKETVLRILRRNLA